MPGAGPRLRRLVLRLRQRRLARSLRHQLLHVGRRDRADLSRAAAQRGDAEAVPEPAATAPFDDVTAEVGLDKVFMPMGANFGDIDNDGFLDIYLGMGNPSFALAGAARAAAQPGRASRSSTSPPRPAPASCTKATASPLPIWTTTATRTSSPRSAARRPATATRCGCSKIPGNGNDWITVKLVGVEEQPRRDRRADQGHGGKRRARHAASIYRTVGSGGSFGASPLEQHIGLGKSARIVDVEIWWPASNTRQHFADVAEEPVRWRSPKASDAGHELERPRLPLGGRTDPMTRAELGCVRCTAVAIALLLLAAAGRRRQTGTMPSAAWS